MRSILLTILILLAGCSEAPQPTTIADEPCLVESAEDFSCAEADAGKRPDQVEHTHNYWGGQDRVEILQETRSLGRSHYGSCDAYPLQVFYPAEDATVYQGTGRIDITASFAPAPDHRTGQLEIWAKAADQDAPAPVGDLTGGTITMEINGSAADLPHQSLSAWEFWVYANPDPTLECRLMPRGEVEIAVEIHRTLEIEPFPGHPDHWANSTELPLVAAHASYDLLMPGYCDGGEASHPDGACQMSWRGFGPQDLIVPPGARTVLLSLTMKPGVGHDETVLGLRYHGADTREFEPVDPVSREGDVAEYEIDVDYRNDGPYATQSQWRFQVVTETDPEAYRGGWTLEGRVVS